MRLIEKSKKISRIQPGVGAFAEEKAPGIARSLQPHTNASLA
jgi:hypothetical protein